MIVIKLELHSARDGSIKELGRAHVSNIGGHLNDKKADYLFEIFRKGSKTKVQHCCVIKNYSRQAYTVWELIRRGLEAILNKKTQETMIDNEKLEQDKLNDFMKRINEIQIQLTRLSKDGFGRQYETSDEISSFKL